MVALTLSQGERQQAEVVANVFLGSLLLVHSSTRLDAMVPATDPARLGSLILSQSARLSFWVCVAPSTVLGFDVAMCGC